MKCLAVCQDEAVAKTLHHALVPTFEFTCLVERQPLARRLQDSGLPCLAGDPRRADSYVKADVTSQTCVIIEDPGKRGLRRVLMAVQDAGAALLYVLKTPNLNGIVISCVSMVMAIRLERFHEGDESPAGAGSYQDSSQFTVRECKAR